MKKKYITLCFLVFSLIQLIKAQTSNELWSLVSEPSKNIADKAEKDVESPKFKLFSLNLELLKNKLNTSTKRGIKGSEYSKTITFPNENGELIEFEVFETATMVDGLQNKFTDIKTYIGKSIEENNYSIRFSISKIGLKAKVLRNKDYSIIIERLNSTRNVYKVYSDIESDVEPFNCETEDKFSNSFIKDAIKQQNYQKVASAGDLRIYKIAVATTGELSQEILNQNNIGSNASISYKKEIILSALVDKINTANAIFERDLSLKFVLIENELDLIFIDPESDPFSIENKFILIEEIQPVMDDILKNIDYDLGHLIGTNACGGLAAPYALCSPTKAKGISSFWGSLFVHEIGHQLGAFHTFNNCNGVGAESYSGVEVGCGKTYMSYGDQPTYFHLISIKQIESYISSVDCGNISVVDNNSPIIEDIENFSIPISTPFYLNASVTDIDGDELSFSWEQLDYEPAEFPLVSTSTRGPAFEWKQPKTSSKRYFPDESTLVAGEISSTTEMLPSVNRTMNFGLLVRDNNINVGSVAYKETSITFKQEAGPFKITSQVEDMQWSPGTEQLITWDVANTDVAPINCSKVNILLSIDGGFSFTEILASEIENNGEYSITVPNISTAGARIKIESVGNIFFSLNKGFISINPPNNLTFVPDDNFELYLIEKGFDDTLDNYVNTSIIENISILELSNRGISILKGIEDFKNLEVLICTFNNLVKLDLRENNKLKYVACDNNKLTKLDVSQNSNLWNLSCSNNNIPTIDLSNIFGLQILLCSNNNLNSLDISSNSNLETVDCSNNKIIDLETTNNINLTNLNCSYNEINTLNVEKNVLLKTLMCSKNNLIQLDITKNIDLEIIECFENELLNLDVSNCKNLIDLLCYFNQITDLNLSQNTELRYLHCSVNNISTLDLSQNLKLNNLACSSNKLSELDLSNKNELTKVNTVFNPDLFCIQVSDENLAKEKLGIYLYWVKEDYVTYSEDCSNTDFDGDGVLNNLDNCPDTPVGVSVNDVGCPTDRITIIPDPNFEQALIDLGIDSDGIINNAVYTSEIENITELNVYNKNITDLTGIEDFINLTHLYCNQNKLTTLNLKFNTKLRILRCHINQLNEIDLSNNLDLEYFLGYSNNLTNLDVSKNLKLYNITCAYNKLTNIDVSKNTNLQNLDCSFNKIESLDLSNNLKLTQLYCNSNKLKELDVSNNMLLYMFRCNDNEITTLNLSNSPNLYELNCEKNKLTELDISLSRVLDNLNCSNNYLISLDVSNNNLLKSLVTNNNLNLSCIQVNQQQLNNVPKEWIKSNETQYSIYCTTVLDDDFDGIANGLDACSETPLGEDVNSDGCSESQLDDDFDGVMNDIDQCPNTTLGDSVDSKGCSASQFPQKTFVPDDHFEQALIDLGYDDFLDDYVITMDVRNISNIDISGLSIKSLQGIEDFSGLIELKCNSNELSELDITKNKKLEILMISYNKLSSLNVSNNSNLELLSAYSNNINLIDLNNNLNLSALYLNINPLVYINLSENRKLRTVYLNSTRLTSLDVSMIINLIYFNTQLNSIGCIQVNQSQLDFMPSVWYKDDYTEYLIDCPEVFDDDFDGVINDIDACPDTPTGENVNETGCSQSQLDDDNDGVMNDVDLCPNTPTGEDVNETGCSQSQLDDDFDGVINGVDTCPDTPTGEDVNETGCSQSQLDDDNDGVMNNIDVCPNTLEAEMVDEYGCSDKTNELFGVTYYGGTYDLGVLFKFDLERQTQTKLIDFNGENLGAYPSGGLVKSLGGKFYGVTAIGGENDKGVLFQYDFITNEFFKLYDFKTAKWPHGLIEASNGKLYGYARKNSLGVLFEYDIVNNTYIEVISFNGDNGKEGSGFLIQASNGKLYGQTAYGGEHNQGTLFEYDISTNTHTILREYDGGVNGGVPGTGLLEISNKKLYSTTGLGGTLNAGIIFEYDIETGNFSKKIDFDKETSWQSLEINLIQALNGKIYGITRQGGIYHQGLLFEYDISSDTLKIKVDFSEFSVNGTLPNGSLLEASNGKLYGMTRGNGIIGNDGALYEYDLTNNILNFVFKFEKEISGKPTNRAFNKLIEITDNDYNDLDGDGVMNDADMCSDTPYGVAVDVNGCRMLSSDNFTIQVISETCPNKDNGKIIINAQSSLNYKATINGAEYDFSTNLTVDNLAPNKYEICIVVTNQTSPYCYNIVILEGTTVSGKASVTSNKASIEITQGTPPYIVLINGKEQLQTVSPLITVDVKHGDLIEIKTGVSCEGVFSKTIDLFEVITVYPNPTSGIFEIALPMSLKEVKIELFSTNTQLISSKTYSVVNGKVQLNIENLPAAMYIAKVHGKTTTSVKIIKK